MKLSADEIATYERAGWIVVRGAVSKDEVADLRSAAEHFEAEAQSLNASSSVIENGCLYALPGSHQGPALDHTEGGIFVGAVPAGSFDESAIEPIILQPGDISLHHVRLLHGSGPNRSNAQRRLLLQGYAAADAWPVMAQHQPSDWPEWDDRMLRGEPTTHARLDGSPVRIPLPVTAALGLFDTQRLMKTSHFEDQLTPESRST